MAFIGRLHPLLIHFPIALDMAAADAEGAASFSADDRWRIVAVRKVRAAAVLALMAMIAGWRLALAPGIETSPLLEWHRLLGTIGAGATLAAAFATSGTVDRRSTCGYTGSHCSPRDRWWPLPGVSEDCWFGARTSCAHEGGTHGMDGRR
jgi:hypothetical protein